jgi:hypothetical protein
MSSYGKLDASDSSSRYCKISVSILVVIFALTFVGSVFGIFIYKTIEYENEFKYVLCKHSECEGLLIVNPLRNGNRWYLYYDIFRHDKLVASGYGISVDNETYYNQTFERGKFNVLYQDCEDKDNYYLTPTYRKEIARQSLDTTFVILTSLWGMVIVLPSFVLTVMGIVYVVITYSRRVNNVDDADVDDIDDDLVPREAV